MILFRHRPVWKSAPHACLPSFAASSQKNGRAGVREQLDIQTNRPAAARAETPSAGATAQDEGGGRRVRLGCYHHRRHGRSLAESRKEEKSCPTAQGYRSVPPRAMPGCLVCWHNRAQHLGAAPARRRDEPKRLRINWPFPRGTREPSAACRHRQGGFSRRRGFKIEACAHEEFSAGRPGATASAAGNPMWAFRRRQAMGDGFEIGKHDVGDRHRWRQGGMKEFLGPGEVKVVSRDMARGARSWFDGA